MCLLLTATLLGSSANAETLPWISHLVSDPFASEEKAAKLVSPDLKPDNCAALPNTNRKLTFNDIVVAALCHNPQTRAAYLGLVSQAASYVGNYSGYLPTASASYSHDRTTSFGPGSKSTLVSSSSGMDLSMVLYDFGQREFKLETAELGLLASGQSYDSTLQGTIASALQGYYSLLTAQNALEVARESESYAKASYEAAKLRHKIGEVPLADELQAKGAYSQTELGIEQAENALALQQAVVAVLMGLKADTPVEVADVDDHSLAKDPFSATIRALMDEAKEKRHDLEASRLGVKSAEKSLQALKRADLATLSVSTNMNVGNDTIHLFNRNATRSQAIGFSVSIPIFTGFSQTYSERAAEESLEAQRETLKSTELSVEQDVWNSWHNYQTAKQSWTTSQDELENATHLKEVALGRYKEGLGTILDVLNAETQYNAALQSALQSRYNLLTSRVDLVRAVGTLDLKTMHPDVSVDVTSRLEKTVNETGE
jgi:outer membrane protein